MCTSAYHSQANGKDELFNHKILAALRAYVVEYLDYWDRVATAVSYGCNTHVHR